MNYRSNRGRGNSIDFDNAACQICRQMAATGIAPAEIANRAIVGPVFTAAGFRAYYLACFPDSIVVLPQGWTGFWLAVSNFNLPVRGMGSLIANRSGTSGHAGLATPRAHRHSDLPDLFHSVSTRRIFREDRFSDSFDHARDQQWRTEEVWHRYTRFSKGLRSTATDVSRTLQIAVVLAFSHAGIQVLAEIDLHGKDIPLPIKGNRKTICHVANCRRTFP
jgi:hypothetical protein